MGYIRARLFGLTTDNFRAAIFERFQPSTLPGLQHDTGFTNLRGTLKGSQDSLSTPDRHDHAMHVDATALQNPGSAVTAPGDAKL